MQFIFDNLSAVLIGSAIILSLGAVHQRSQTAATEASMFYSLKQQQLSFIDLLQHDLNATVRVVSVEVEPASNSFRFETRPDPSSTNVREVTYTWVPVREVDGTSYARIARYVDGIESGSSVDFVTRWDIRVLNGEGRPVASAADGRELRVDLELTYPAPANLQTVREAKWQKTFHPPLLQRNTTI